MLKYFLRETIIYLFPPCSEEAITNPVPQQAGETQTQTETRRLIRTDGKDTGGAGNDF